MSNTNKKSNLELKRAGIDVGAFKYTDKVICQFLKDSGEIPEGTEKKIHPATAKVLEMKKVVKVLNWDDFKALQEKRRKEKEKKEETKGKQPKYNS